MNVKTEITLGEEYLRYAERMVENGAYPSISSVVEAGIAQMMVENDGPAKPLVGIADEIRRRAMLPPDQWLPWDGSAMAERVKTKLRARFND